MGMNNKWVAVTVIGVLAVTLVGTGAIDTSNIPFLSGADTPDDPKQVSGDMADVDDWELSSQVKFPQSLSSGDVMLFVDEPENYGNYVDWDSSNAKSGLSQGIDYYEQTGQSSDTVDLGYVPSGEYYMVVTDSNFQTKFLKVTVPEQVKESFAENDKKITLARSGDFHLDETFGSDNIVVYDNDGNVLNTGTNIDDPSSNGTRTIEIVREIEVDTGVAYLGKYDVTSFNDGDGIEEVDLRLTAGGHTCTVELKDGNSGELADSTSHGADLDTCISSISDVETDPVQENDKIEMAFDVTYTANTDVASADDSKIGPGESMFTMELDDIFGSDVSSDKSITG